MVHKKILKKIDKNLDSLKKTNLRYYKVAKEVLKKYDKSLQEFVRIQPSKKVKGEK